MAIGKIDNFKDLVSGARVDRFGHILYKPKTVREKPNGWDKWQNHPHGPKMFEKSGLDIFNEALEESKKTETVVVDGVEVFKPTDRFIELEQQILEDENGWKVLVKLATLKGADLKAIENKLISAKVKDDYVSTLQLVRFDYACYIPWADVDRIRNAVIESKEPYGNLFFAHFFWDENFVEEHQKVVIDSGKMGPIRSFAQCVKGADIRALQEKTEESGEFRDWLRFGLYVEGADVESLDNLIDDRMWRTNGAGPCITRCIEGDISPIGDWPRPSEGRRREL